MTVMNMKLYRVSYLDNLGIKNYSNDQTLPGLNDTNVAYAVYYDSDPDASTPLVAQRFDKIGSEWTMHEGDFGIGFFAATHTDGTEGDESTLSSIDDYHSIATVSVDMSGDGGSEMSGTFEIFSSDDLTSVSVTFADNTALTSVDLATVARLEACTITGNTSLATIMAPNGDDPLTPGATTGFTITGNSLTATYTYAEAAVQDGINNTPYQQATIENASLESWKDYIYAISATNTPVTFSLDYDASSNASNDNFADDVADDSDNNAAPAFAGTIDTDAELAIIN